MKLCKLDWYVTNDTYSLSILTHQFHYSERINIEETISKVKNSLYKVGYLFLVHLKERKKERNTFILPKKY